MPERGSHPLGARGFSPALAVKTLVNEHFRLQRGSEEICIARGKRVGISRFCRSNRRISAVFHCGLHELKAWQTRGVHVRSLNTRRGRRRSRVAAHPVVLLLRLRLVDGRGAGLQWRRRHALAVRIVPWPIKASIFAGVQFIGTAAPAPRARSWSCSSPPDGRRNPARSPGPKARCCSTGPSGRATAAVRGWRAA